MSSVKGAPPRAEWHAALLLGQLFRRLGDAFGEGPGLRQSQLRVVSSVPAEGISVTDLARRVGMTKQGCGQFVAVLADSGHLAVEPRPEDRRVRLVRRTPEGERATHAARDRVLELEDAWAAQVGPERYRVFREVLEEVATGVWQAEGATVPQSSER
ncbi:MarR family winged helix-turn-helix transcriptional regulator [Nocardioides aurantiacus]|uniref:DNA-binding MarR family transcriptional regulator n=1 Tax=Nocardioides aurantiacus TaxID=86796 RepID=A0A3N2CSK0_9ACTN|nr:MarR family winged helix-turn-helix transcriptional regulator [Nocardioides aurantiacus]ROR90527.1 DNA-binding MarR family transcriptional regulator [Nocardioides aurantiacus]